MLHVTHVAMNAPIDLPVKSMAQALAPVARSGVARTNGSGITAASISDENIMRSPTNLRPLYGDFGPDSLFSTRESGPGQADSDAAFWVETSQLSGIRQVWAPRWTMFSRGNIREKGRILGQQSTFPGLTEEDLNQPLPAIDVVDFYVGIGYFALSYLKRGIRRVFGWEINGWSVEGLRRGCERNGWQCLTVSVSADVEGRDRAVGVVVKALHDMCDLRCIVFHGDNQFAEGTMAAVRDVLKKEEVAINVRHCNLGLLPTSKGSWEGGVSCIDTKWGGWLHVHENAEISQVEVKRQAILDILAAMVKTKKGNGWQISCEHTEMVKTYAPGVGHFVFDIKLWPAR
ncbi:S-adenosylmethionine-dependent methyltransferase [Neophaeococcomyces mojaviensis]|uniref:S-adenosylmethionine-dependent methyltransferase n=1 Tax=Neophaeococcomyces mojaviensis TaxID=3383035 RepID=A0ACC3A2M3_9EURO|nr:S-adenosylmethionine-dependent methyltransferase [Knufia sp. JES_112]